MCDFIPWSSSAGHFKQNWVRCPRYNASFFAKTGQHTILFSTWKFWTSHRLQLPEKYAAWKQNWYRCICWPSAQNCSLWVSAVTSTLPSSILRQSLSSSRSLQQRFWHFNFHLCFEFRSKTPVCVVQEGSRSQLNASFLTSTNPNQQLSGMFQKRWFENNPCFMYSFPLLSLDRNHRPVPAAVPYRV